MLAREAQPVVTSFDTATAPVQIQKSERLGIIELVDWIVAISVSLVVFFLLTVRLEQAGGLWRDECGALQLARMPTLADLVKNFSFESFPLLFPAVIRIFTNIFGTSEIALRSFGIGVGVLLLCTAWLSARLLKTGVPLLLLTLIGLNTTFLTWGTSLRGYGLGSVLIVLAFGLVGRLILEPTPSRIIAAAFVCLASVQCLFQNSVLVLAIVGSAIAVCLIALRFRTALVLLGMGLLCLLSLLYVDLDSGSSSWRIVSKSPVTLSSFRSGLNLAFGSPLAIAPWLWQFLFLALVVGSIWRLCLIQRGPHFHERDLIVYAALVAITAAIGHWAFLCFLGQSPQPWYYLAFLCVLGSVLDLLAANLARLPLFRIARLTFVVLAVPLLAFNAWPKLIERQTNIDDVAQTLESNATRADLIVVSPWQLGVSFDRYYHGSTHWVTLPQMEDHRIHRYDLFKEKMTSSHPLDDVVDAVSHTLSSGNRVWVVGGIRFLRNHEAPLSLPPAPGSNVGWNNVAYMQSWKGQFGAFIQAHALRSRWIGSLIDGPVNPLESVPLVLVEGWRE